MHQQEAFKHLQASSLRGLAPIDETQDIYISQVVPQTATTAAVSVGAVGGGGIFPSTNHQFIPNSSSSTSNFNIPLIQHQYQPTQPQILIQHLNFQQQQQQLQQQQQQQQQLQQFQHIQMQQQSHQQQTNNNNNNQQIIIHPPLSSLENNTNGQLLPFGSSLSLPPRKFHKLGEPTQCKSTWVCWTCLKTLCADCTDHNAQHTISNLESIFDAIPESTQSKLTEDYQSSISSLGIIEISFNNCLKSIKETVENAFVRLQLCKASSAKDYQQMGKLLLSNYKLATNSEESQPLSATNPQSQHSQPQPSSKQQILEETMVTTKDTLEKSLKGPLDKLSGFLSQMTQIMVDTITKAIQTSDPFITSAQSPFQQPNYFQQFNNSKNITSSNNSNNSNNNNTSTNNFNSQLNFHPPHNLHPRVIQVNEIPTNYARMIGQQVTNSIKPKMINSNPNPNISQKISSNSQDGLIDNPNQLPYHNSRTNTANLKNPIGFVERQFGYIDAGPYKKLDIEGGNAITRPNSQQQQQMNIQPQKQQFHKSSSGQVSQQSSLQQLSSPHGILSFNGNNINNAAEIFEKLILNNPHQSQTHQSDKIDYSSGSTIPCQQVQSIEINQNKNDNFIIENGNSLESKRQQKYKRKQSAFNDFQYNNMSIKDIARKYGVVESTIKAWISMFENNQKLSSSQNHKSIGANYSYGNNNNNSNDLSNSQQLSIKSTIPADSNDGYGINSTHNNENKLNKLNSCELSDSIRKDQNGLKIEHNSSQNYYQNNLDQAKMEDEEISQQDKEQNDRRNQKQEEKEEENNYDQDQNNNNTNNRFIKEEADSYNQYKSKVSDSIQQPNILSENTTTINSQHLNNLNQQQQLQQLQNQNEQDNNNNNSNNTNHIQQQSTHQNASETQQRPLSIQSEDDPPQIEIKMKLICFPLLNNIACPTIPLRSSMLGQSINNKLFIKTQNPAENNIYDIIATHEFDNDTKIEELKFGKIASNEIVILIKLSNMSLWLWEWQQGLEAAQVRTNIINFDVFEMNNVLLIAVQEQPFQINVFQIHDNNNRLQLKNKYHNSNSKTTKEDNRQVIYDIDSDESSNNKELQDGCNNKKIPKHNKTEIAFQSGISSKLIIEQIICLDNIKPKEQIVRDQLRSIQNFVFWGCRYTNRLFLACNSGNYFWSYKTEENDIAFSIAYETFSDDQQDITTLRLYKNLNSKQEIIGTSETGLLYFFDVMQKNQSFFKTKQRESKKMIDIQVFHNIEDTRRDIGDDCNSEENQEDPKVILCYDNYIRIRSHKKLVFPQPMRCASLEVKDNEITVYYIVTNSATLFKHSLVANAG